MSLARARRRLDRERTARLEAETISERALRELYDKQQGLILLETVATAANEAYELAGAIRSALDAVREHRSWPLGHAWLRAPDGSLASTEIWSGDVTRYSDFRTATARLRFGPGEGLPGRVMVEHGPVWVLGAEELNALPRGAAIARAGWQTALCFPVLAGSEIVGVLEFFSEQAIEPDEDLLTLMGQVGTQLGRVIERARAAETLERQATHDPLTGLPNRVLILDELRNALSRQQRDGDGQTAVFFLDLDGFKSVNDTLGHAAGDRVLQQVATRLHSVLRPHDILGRLSGDEFVVLCERLEREFPIVTIAERLGGVLREPFELDGEPFLVTASIGIVLSDGTDDPATLIAQADAAMYRSKELGRARHEIFSEELRVRIERRLDVDRALRHAVARDELCLHYQPEVDLCTGEVVGVEALLRWQRPEGMVMPDDFIPLAEETGLIVGLGAWVLDEAMRQSRVWDCDPAIVAAPWMSVNLSVRQLADPALMDSVAAALADHQTDPSRLFLEVTESLILDDAEAGLTVLTELKALGTEIAIDDFGTGYASLSYLLRFPATVLKIDRSFIATVADDPRSRSIVSAMVDMAHALGLLAVAEGIETAEQLSAVQQLGCDIGQGYHFARPAVPDDLIGLLSTPRPFAEQLGL